MENRMICNKCGKETNLVCLCGKCNQCNGMTKEIEMNIQKEFNEFLEKNKKLLKELSK